MILECFHHHPDSFIVMNSSYLVVAFRSSEMVHEINYNNEHYDSWPNDKGSSLPWRTCCRCIELSKRGEIAVMRWNLNRRGSILPWPSREYFLRRFSFVFILIAIAASSDGTLTNQRSWLNVQHRVRTFSSKYFFRHIRSVVAGSRQIIIDDDWWRWRVVVVVDWAVHGCVKLILSRFGVVVVFRCKLKNNEIN